MGEDKLKNKVSSLLIMGLLLLPGVLILVPNVSGGSSWTETSDIDFNNGTLTNVGINGPGSAA